jgi:hypothetical protein
MFQQLSVKRLHRRGKEWWVRAQCSLREGYITEEKDRQAAREQVIHDKAVAAKKAKTAAMFRDAKMVDKPWMK